MASAYAPRRGDDQAQPTTGQKLLRKALEQQQQMWAQKYLLENHPEVYNQTDSPFSLVAVVALAVLYFREYPVALHTELNGRFARFVHNIMNFYAGTSHERYSFWEIVCLLMSQPFDGIIKYLPVLHDDIRNLPGVNRADLILGRGDHFHRFLQLPLEIRQTIYEYSLSFPPLHVTPEAPFTAEAPITYRHAASHCSLYQARVFLLRANKQIRSEALPIFYARNTFRFRTLYDMDRLLFGLGATGINSVGRLSLIGPGHMKKEEEKEYGIRLFDLLSQLPHLQEFQLCVNESSLSSIDKEDRAPDDLPISRELRQIRGVWTVRKISGSLIIKIKVS